jgi:Tol biopolymer transport system component
MMMQRKRAARAVSGQQRPGARRLCARHTLSLLGCLLLLGTTQHASVQAQISLVSVTANNRQAEGRSDSPATSADGRFVAFVSNASNIVNEGDRQNEFDVFVRDRSQGTVELVSISLTGTSGNADSSSPAISGDGNIVAFSSRASNLVDDDQNGVEDVFVRDRGAGTTQRISVGVDGEANGASSFPRVSADGRFVVFQSQATNLVGDEDTPTADIFVYDRDSGATSKVSVPAAGGLANAASITPAISGDGTTVAFISSATNLIENDGNGVPDVFVRVLAGTTIERVSVSSSGTPANEISFLPALNFDGNLVAFKSEAFNLVPNDTNGEPDTFVRDRNAGTTTRISVDDFGNQSNGLSGPPSISGDGCDVAFPSQASNLVLEDKNGHTDLFVVDRCERNGQRRIVRIGESPTNINGPNGEVPDAPPSVSQNGQWIAFASNASDLVPDDLNNELDTFITGNPLNPPGSQPTATPTPSPSETPEGFCDGNEDCPPGQVCDPETNRCVTPSPTPTVTQTGTPVGFCDGNEDCPPGQVCDPVSHRCVTPSPTKTPIGHCDGNEDCLPGQVCDPVTNMCVTPTPTPTPVGFCDGNEDCPPGQVCDPTSHSCVTASPTRTPVGLCDGDEDCPEGQECNLETHMCVPKDGGGGGCSCEIDPRQRREDPAAALAVLIPAALLWMRRRDGQRRRRAEVRA